MNRPRTVAAVCAALLLAPLAAVPAAATTVGAEDTAAPSCDRPDRVSSDLDGDGVSDAVVGAPLATVDGKAQAGLVTVAYGSKRTWVPERVDTVAPGVGGVSGGAKPRSNFGEAVEVLFADDDSCADVIIGAPGTKAGGKKSAGVAYLVYGAAGGLGSDRAAVKITPGSKGVPGAAAKDDGFGAVITSSRGLVDSRLVAFGIPNADVGGVSNAGAVVVAELGADGRPVGSSGWLYTQETPGIPDDSTENDKFGQAVALGDPQDLAGSSATLFIGSPGEDLGEATESGAVTVVDGPDLDDFVAERWVQGTAPLSDTIEKLDRLGNSLAYGADPATGEIALLIGAPGEEVGVVHEAGAAHLLDGCTELSDCDETFLTQGSGPVSDQAETQDRFGTRLAFAPGGTSLRGLVAIIGVPGEKVGTAGDAGMVHVVETRDHSVVHPPIDASRADIPGEAVVGDRLGDAVAALAPTPNGWLGMIVIGVSGKAGGRGEVITVPFAPDGATGPSSRPKVWTPGVAPFPAVDAGFGLAVGTGQSVG